MNPLSKGGNTNQDLLAILSLEGSYLPPSTYQRSNMYTLMTNVITTNRVPASPKRSQSIFEPTMCHYGGKACSGLCGSDQVAIK